MRSLVGNELNNLQRFWFLIIEYDESAFKIKD